ncbi:MAG TPA: PqqD family protein [Caulobacteraceae bacterium]|jgi:hypothetical protein|nr:PqqD family protein [Caulobacteraceae bacterium]
MSAASLDDVVVQSRQVLAAATDDEVLAMDEASGNCFSLGGSGREIWLAAKAPISVRELCAALRRRYRVAEADCAAQTLAYVDELIAEGLLTTVRSQPER